MELLRDSMRALSETCSMESDISTSLGASVQGRRPGSGNRRKQSKPTRGTDSPSCSEPAPPAARQTPSGYYLSGAGALAADSSASGSVVAGSPVQTSKLAASGARSRRHSSPAGPCGNGPCGHCGAVSSPQWRKGPKGKACLCNACGIRYLRNRTLIKIVPKRRRAGGASAAAASASKRSKTGGGSPGTEPADMASMSAVSEDASTDAGTLDVTSPSRKHNKQQLLQAASLQQLLQSASDQAAPGVAAAARSAAPYGAVSLAQLFNATAEPPAAAAGGYSSMRTAGSGNAAYLNSVASVALAYQQLYQQQQQLLLYRQQHPLLLASAGNQQAPAGAGTHTTNRSGNSTSSEAGSPLLLVSTGVAPAQGINSAPPAQQHPQQHGVATGCSAQRGNPAATYTSLQLQSLQHYVALQQRQQQQQAASLLHGPSPLSVMTSSGLPASGMSLSMAAAVQAAAARRYAQPMGAQAGRAPAATASAPAVVAPTAAAGAAIPGAHPHHHQQQ